MVSGGTNFGLNVLDATAGDQVVLNLLINFSLLGIDYWSFWRKLDLVPTGSPILFIKKWTTECKFDLLLDCI